jgi:hypothetical protein
MSARTPGPLALLPLCLLGFGLVPAPCIAQTPVSDQPPPPVVEPAADSAAPSGVAIGVLAGSSFRGLQGGLRLNVGVSRRVSLDVDYSYWGWIRFRDQHHLEVVRAELRFGSRQRNRWNTVWLIGAATIVNTPGYTGVVGVGWERQGAGRTRVTMDLAAGLFSVYANLGVMVSSR